MSKNIIIFGVLFLPRFPEVVTLGSSYFGGIAILPSGDVDTRRSLVNGALASEFPI
jgi:hypothetical protein